MTEQLVGSYLSTITQDPQHGPRAFIDVQYLYNNAILSKIQLKQGQLYADNTLQTLYKIYITRSAIVKKILTSTVISLMLALSYANTAMAECSPLLNFERQPLTKTEKPINLCQQYQGKVILMVNTASKCGYTYQYEGLEELYRRYKERGLVVLGFPSNDFAGQEPGTAEQIESFCRLTFGVQFPMFDKTSVAAGTSDPLFKALAAAGGGYPEWNFHKYIIGRDGKLVASYASRTEPLGKDIVNTIEGLL